MQDDVNLHSLRMLGGTVSLDETHDLDISLICSYATCALSPYKT